LNVPLRQGKLPPELLSRLLGSLSAGEAIVGPRLGEDAAVIAAPGGLLIVTADPLTFPSADPARNLVQINANDIAAMGGEPRWLLATVLLSPGTREPEVVELMRSLAAACAAAGVELIGGHTEVTDAVRRTVVAGTMLGTVERNRLVLSGGARPGDSVIVSKPIAIEGTAILAEAAYEALLAAGMTGQELARARALSTAPGISVLADSRILCRERPPHALHDVTEGGLATALREMSEASAVGMRIDRGAIPILPECAHICDALRLDPLGLIGSGSLLAAVAPGEATAACAALRAAGMAGARIGEVTPDPELMLVDAGRASTPLPAFARDELARYFEEQAR
jgi:hydrogenase expression/formation protein HypE